MKTLLTHFFCWLFGHEPGAGIKRYDTEEHSTCSWCKAPIYRKLGAEADLKWRKQ